MAASGAKKFACGLAAVPLLLLSVICLIAVIVIATVGVELANNVNQCSSANVPNDTICENIGVNTIRAMPLNDSSTAETMTVDPSLRGINEREYLYWLAGATGCGVLWSVVNTFALWVLVAVLVWFHEEEKEEEAEKKKKKKSSPSESPSEGIELQPIAAGGDVPLTKPTGGTDHPDSTDDIEVKIDRIGKYIIKEWQTTPIRNFGPLSLLALFFSCFCFICSLLCMLWGVAISFDHARRSQRTIDAYIGVEILVAILLPILLFISAILFAMVLNYITVGHVDGRTAIKRFLPSVSFLEGEKNDYWVIENTFYFSLKKKNDRLNNGCWYSVDHSLSTWFLVVIVCVSFHLAISYFVDITLDEQVTVGNCNDPRIDRSFDCFKAGSLDFVDCTESGENTFNGSIHCFRFYRFGVDVDLISSLATAFAFYLATVGIFAHIFSVVRILLHIKPSRFWGIGFLLIGVLAFITAIITTVVWANGYASDTVGELLRLNIINVAQFFMVAVFLLMVGMLLAFGKWWEKIKSKDTEIVRSLPLVHYSDTSRKDISEVEKAHLQRDEDKKPEDPGITHLDAPPTNITAVKPK